jgi:hypothetical protein
MESATRVRVMQVDQRISRLELINAHSAVPSRNSVGNGRRARCPGHLRGKFSQEGLGLITASLSSKQHDKKRSSLQPLRRDKAANQKLLPSCKCRQLKRTRFNRTALIRWLCGWSGGVWVLPLPAATYQLPSMTRAGTECKGQPVLIPRLFTWLVDTVRLAFSGTR